MGSTNLIHSRSNFQISSVCLRASYSSLHHLLGVSQKRTRRLSGMMGSDFSPAILPIQGLVSPLRAPAQNIQYISVCLRGTVPRAAKDEQDGAPALREAEIR